MFCSGERVKFWRKYGNEKILTIQRLYSEKKCSKLKDELADYLEALKYYGRKKIGFCFNPELLEIGIKLLIMEDAENTRTEKAYKKKYAKWLNIVKKIPYQHFDKIENSFGGTRTKADVLKEKKHLCYNRLQQFCDEYYAGKEKETGSI